MLTGKLKGLRNFGGRRLFWEHNIKMDIKYAASG